LERLREEKAAKDCLVVDLEKELRLATQDTQRSHTDIFDRSSAFRRLCVASAGVLFQDNLIAVEYQEAIHSLSGRCHGTIELGVHAVEPGKNLSDADMYLELSADDKRSLVVTPLPSSAPPGPTFSRVLNVELKGFFRGPLGCRFQVRVAGLLHSVDFELPLIMTKFVVPLLCDTNNFFELWWDSALSQCADVVSLAHTVVQDPEALLARVSLGGRMHCVCFRPHPPNTGHRWRDTQIAEAMCMTSGRVPAHGGRTTDALVLVKCWAGSSSDHGTAKLEVKSTDAALGKLVLETIVRIVTQDITANGPTTYPRTLH